MLPRPLPSARMAPSGFVQDPPTSTFGDPPGSPPECLYINPRDIWIARFDTNPQTPPRYEHAPTWEHIIEGAADEAAFGIAVDAYGRPTITGHFGVERCGQNIVYSSLDFDPDPLQSAVLYTNGGYDAFVATFNPDGTFHEAFQVGSDWNEYGTGIAFSPDGDFGLHHVGSFGGRHTPAGYEANFDPHGIALATGYGSESAFISTVEAAVPQDVVVQLSLVIDASGSMQPYWHGLMSIYGDMLSDPDVVPQDGTVAMNVIHVGNYQLAREVMPWTQITPYSAPLFAQAVELSLQVLPFGGHAFADGLILAADSMDASGIDACWRVAHMLMQDHDDASSLTMADARDAVLNPGPGQVPINQINGVALPGALGSYLGSPQYLIDNVIGSTEPGVEFVAGVDDRWHSNSVVFWDEIPYWLWIVLRRETRCPGDYDRNGVVNAQDETAFVADLQIGAPYADWDLDRTFTLADYQKFSISIGAPCPCDPE